MPAPAPSTPATTDHGTDVNGNRLAASTPTTAKAANPAPATGRRHRATQAETGADQQADDDDASDEGGLVVGAEVVDAEAHDTPASCR